MAFCDITPDQYDRLIVTISKRVMLDEVKDLQSLMLEIHDMVFKAKGNRVQALTYAGLVPSVLSLIASKDSNLSKKIRAVIDMNQLFKLKDDISDNLAEVNRYIFGFQSSLTDEQASDTIAALEETEDYLEYKRIVSQPEIVTYLNEPGNEELKSKFNSKFYLLKNEYVAELTARMQAEIKKVAAEKEEAKKKEQEAKKDEDKTPFEFAEDKDITEVEQTNIEPLGAVAYITSNKSTNQQVEFDEDSAPDDEARLNENEFDNLITKFYNKHKLTDNEKFDVYLQNDTPALITKRFLKEEDKTKALENIGQVAIFKLKTGQVATFGNTGVVTDTNNPYYDVPIVTSVNQDAFDKYIEARADIYSTKLGIPFDEVMRYYEIQKTQLLIARGHLKRGEAFEYPLTIIHQSPGVIETTEEGSVQQRFRKGSESALKAIRILPTDDKVKGVQFTKGQVVVIVEGATKEQAFAASAPKIGNLEGATGKLIKDAIDFFLFKDYATEQEARDIANNFFKKILYTKAGMITISVGKNPVTNRYEIKYTKKNKRTGKTDRITLTNIDSQRINVSERLFNDTLEVPTSTGSVVVDSAAYYDMMMQNIATNRKAIRDSKNNFHLDTVNAYFSFALPHDLNPKAFVVKTVEVVHVMNDIPHTYVVVLKSDNKNEIYENGKRVSIIDLPGEERDKIFDKLYQDVQDNAPLKEVVDQPGIDLLPFGDQEVTNQEAFPKEEKQVPTEESVEQPEQPEQPEAPVERPDGPPISSAPPKIRTDYETNLGKATESVIPFMIGGKPIVVDINAVDPFYANMKGKPMTPKNVEDLNKLLQEGKKFPTRLSHMVSGQYYIIGVKGYSFYQVFDRNFRVVPSSVLEAGEIEKYNKKNPCK